MQGSTKRRIPIEITNPNPFLSDMLLIAHGISVQNRTKDSILPKKNKGFTNCIPLTLWCNRAIQLSQVDTCLPFLDLRPVDLGPLLEVILAKSFFSFA